MDGDERFPSRSFLLYWRANAVSAFGSRGAAPPRANRCSEGALTNGLVRWNSAMLYWMLRANFSAIK